MFDLGKSNKQIWFEVLRCTQMSLYVAFDSIYKRVKSGESQLFEATPYGKGAYSEDDFKEIYLEIAKCQSLFKPYEKQVKL